MKENKQIIANQKTIKFVVSLLITIFYLLFTLNLFIQKNSSGFTIFSSLISVILYIGSIRLFAGKNVYWTKKEFSLFLIIVTILIGLYIYSAINPPYIFPSEECINCDWYDY